MIRHKLRCNSNGKTYYSTTGEKEEEEEKVGPFIINDAMNYDTAGEIHR